MYVELGTPEDPGGGAVPSPTREEPRPRKPKRARGGGTPGPTRGEPWPRNPRRSKGSGTPGATRDKPRPRPMNHYIFINFSKYLFIEFGLQAKASILYVGFVFLAACWDDCNNCYDSRIYKYNLLLKGSS